MADRSVVVRLMANIADFKAQMKQAERSVKGVGDESEKTSQQATTSLGRLTESAQKNEKAWSTAGTALAGFGAVTALALGATIKAAIDWESAWAGVAKTVDGSADEMAALEGELRGLARTLPATHGEIAAVAEAAGQLGIQRENVAAFTRTMIDLGESTSLSAEDAATSLAQMMNVMRTSPDEVDRMGSALVALGNAGASTEADILSMAQRLSGAGALIGASEADVLALASAMADVGIEAQLGGGVMTRVLQKIHAATLEGGDALSEFAKVAGMSSADFAKSFEADPIRAISLFTQGLDKVNSSGGNVVATLSDLGLKGTEEASVLLRLMGASDGLATSLDTSNEAWEQNSALVEEAAKRYDTTASKMAMARNNITDAAIEIGEVFLPMLASAAESVADLAGWFADLPDPIQGAIGGLAGVAGVAALAGGAFLLLFPRVIETYKAFQGLKTDMPGVASGLGKVGKAAGVAGAIAAIAPALYDLAKSSYPAVAGMESTTKAMLDMRNSMQSVDEMFADLSMPSFEINGLADAAERLTHPSLKENLDNFVGEILSLGSDEGAPGRDRVVKQIDQMGQSLALMVESGNADLAAKQFELLAAEWVRGGGTVEDLKNLMPAYGEALQGVENEQKLAGESARVQGEQTALLAQNLDAAYGSIEGYAAALGLSEDATADLITKTSELGTSLADFINPLGAYTGLLDEKKAAEEEAARKAAEAAGAGADSWEDFVRDTGFSFDEYMRRLEEQVTAQTNWQTNMLILAGRVSEGTLAELARMGPEGAPLVADLVKRSDAELDRFDDIAALRSKEAMNAWGAQLTMAAPVLTAIAGMAGQGVADELARKLAAGTTTIAAIAAEYGVALASGVNPILQGLGKPQIDAWGTYRPTGFVGPVAPNVNGRPPGFVGPVKNADGNLYEDHTAQIAPAGAWRLWAEPETGGEAYIPLHPGKRTRSVDIWRQVGDRLGVQFQEFAFGGISDVPKPRSTAPFQPPLSTAADATMQKAYAEITEWLTANLEPAESPSSSSGLGPRAAAARQHVIDTWGITNIGGFAKRNIYGTSTPSKHSMGKAIDVMTSNLRIGWEIANFFNGPGRGQFGVDNVIWQQSIAGRGGGPFRPMPDRGSPTQNHMDHPHIDFLKKGGILNPHVRDTGGPLLPGYTFNGTGRPETVIANRHFTDASYSSASVAAAAQAPVQFVGDLYLDSGEFLGVVRGEAESVAVGALTGMGQTARNGVRI